MRIQTNTSALKAKNSFTKVNTELGKALEKLSSGYSINRAADNAAGLAVSEKMRYMITGLEQGELNIQDGSSYVQVAEGALFEIEEMLNRSKELTEQAMNGTYTEAERKSINDEIDQIKSEIDRIITSASFNGLSIWGDDNCSKKIVDYVEKSAMRFLESTVKVNVTNKNKDYFPCDAKEYFTIDANEDGYVVKWDAADGNSYETKRISWPNPLEGIHYMTIGSNCNPKLNDFDLNLPFEITEGAEIKDVVAAMNGWRYFTSVDTNVYCDAEVANDNHVWCEVEFTYDYLIDSDVNMESVDNMYVEPTLDTNGNNVVCPTNLSDTWKIGLTLRTVDSDGNVSYKDVVAESESITYFSLNRDDPTWYTGFGWRRRTVQGGTLSDALSVLDSTQVNPSIAGQTDARISVNFKIIDGNDNLGTITLTYGTGSNDTVSTMFNEITNTHRITKVDVPNKTDLKVSISPNVDDVKVNSPVYEANYDVVVQGGLEENEQIHITYDQLSLEVMGMDTASVLSQEEAVKTFDAITEALSIVTKQHGEFGSYTNRLEHASNSNLNRFENLQASESRIRDTDMAKTMMKYTSKNILMQAAQTLLAQANTRPEMVLQMMN